MTDLSRANNNTGDQSGIELLNERNDSALSGKELFLS